MLWKDGMTAKKEKRPVQRLTKIIRNRFIPFFFLGMLIILLLFSLIEFVFNFADYTERRREFIEGISSTLESHLRYADMSLSLLAELIENIEEREERETLFRLLFETFPYYRLLAVIDTDEKIASSYPQTIEGRSFSEVDKMRVNRPHREAGGLQCRISDPYVSAEDGRVTINMLRETASGHTILAELDLDFLQEVIKEGVKESDVARQVFLTDRYGNIIAHPESRYVEEQVNLGAMDLIAETAAEARDNGEEADRFNELVELFGRRYFAEAYFIETAGWVLVDAIGSRDFYAYLFRSLFVMTGFLLLLLAALAFYVRNLIIRVVIHPLTYFLHIVERSVWEDEPLSIEDTTATFSELLILQKAFNVMTARIRERDQKLRKYLKAMQEAGFAIYITDIEGNIEYVNPAFIRLTGYEETEVLRRTPKILSSGKQAKEYYRRLWECIMRGEVWDEEIINRKKSGEEYYAHQTIAPIYDAEGEMSHFVAIQSDITDRRRAEEDLRRSEEKYRLLAESSTDLISRHDLEGVYTYASPASYRLLAYRPEELVGRNAYELFHPEDLEEIRRSHEAISGESDVYNVIYRIRRKDGSYTWFETVSRMLHDEETGKPREIFAISRDVSDRKRIEDELRVSKERAEEANRSKSDFLANISHEIRTPMNSVLGYAQLLSRGIDEPLLSSYVESIEKSGSMLLALINDILDLSKIESGRLELEYGDLEIHPFLEDIRRVFEFRAREKGLSFEVEIDSKVPVRLSLDEVRLRQILLNLIGNGLKFTEEGKVIMRVSVEEEKEEKEGTGGRIGLRIEVTDTGIGIPKSQRERIFEAFRQKEGQSSRKYGGTGLGLAISRRLVEAMRGSLAVESEEGRGSTFSVSIPEVKVLEKKGREESKGNHEEKMPAGKETERQTEDLPAAGGEKAPVEPERLLSQLEQGFLPRWEAARSSMFVDELEDFAKDLRSLVEDHGESELRNYAELLLSAAESFDVGLLTRLTEQFAERVEALRERIVREGR